MTIRQKVFLLLTKIPPGKVTTYKEIARALNTKAYQAIGQIIKKNPNAPTVPCHRVIKSDGTLGGYGGKTKGEKVLLKKKLLKQEGIKFRNNKIQNFEQVFCPFSPADI